MSKYTQLLFFIALLFTITRLLYCILLLIFLYCHCATAWHGMELPPSVESDDSSVDLPPVVNSDGDEFENDAEPLTESELNGMMHCFCKMQCHKNKSLDSRELRAAQLVLTPREHGQRVFETVKRHVVSDTGEVVKKTNWTVKGHRVCRPFFEWCSAVGHATLDRFCKLAREGAVVLPDGEKLPRMPRFDVGQQAIKADSWFLDVYRKLAEPQAISDNALLDEKGSEVLEDASHPLWSTAINLPGSDKRSVPCQYLNPGCFEDLFLQYETSTEPEERVSKSTLFSVWKRNWRRVLRFRNVGQGKRCKLCAKLDEERAQATTEEERVLIGQQKQAHIDEILADRAVTGRTINMAESDVSRPNDDGHDQLIAITIDGMDQAKFKVPRNLASSAEFESLWRPQLHVTGAICHGHLECYFIMGTDQAKDSNMNATVIARTLDLVKQKLSPHALPQNLVIQADNTTRESKNQFFALFLSYLVASGKFSVSELQFLQVGHTHNQQDQRFSSVATSLSRAPVLEDPEDFAAWIRGHVKPARGRDLHVEVLSSTWDFQGWFQSLGVQVQGLAATHAEPSTSHCWRICRRSLLPEVGPICETWDGGNHEADAVLLVKEFLHHTRLSQQPLVLLPHMAAMTLHQPTLKVKQRNPLGDRVLAEFRKTASAVSKEPWKLFKAQQYLEELCRQNEAEDELSVGVELDVIFNYEMPSMQMLGNCPLAPLTAPGHAVRSVVVKPKPVPKAKAAPDAAGHEAAALAPKGKAAPRSKAELKKRPATAKRPAANIPDSEPVPEVGRGVAAEPGPEPAVAAAAVEPDTEEPAAERGYGCAKCRGKVGCTTSCKSGGSKPWTREQWDEHQEKKKRQRISKNGD